MAHQGNGSVSWEPAARQNLTRDIVEYAVNRTRPALVVDFEEVPDASQAHFPRFHRRAGTGTAFRGVEINDRVARARRCLRYEYFGKKCDAIVLMNYDQHWLTSPPAHRGAGLFVENLRQVLEVVPRRRSSWHCDYAYDWSTAPKNENEPAAEFDIQGALLHVKESETDVEFDSDSLNPHYSYYDEHNHVHQVWMLDAVTAYTNCAPAKGSEFRARRYGGWIRGHLSLADLGCRARRTTRPGKN